MWPRRSVFPRCNPGEEPWLHNINVVVHITKQNIQIEYFYKGNRQCILVGTGLDKATSTMFVEDHYFRPAFFAAVRALFICFFQP